MPLPQWERRRLLIMLFTYNLKILEKIRFWASLSSQSYSLVMGTVDVYICIFSCFSTKSKASGVPRQARQYLRNMSMSDVLRIKNIMEQAIYSECLTKLLVVILRQALHRPLHATKCTSIGVFLKLWNYLTKKKECWLIFTCNALQIMFWFAFVWKKYFSFFYFIMACLIGPKISLLSSQRMLN